MFISGLLFIRGGTLEKATSRRKTINRNRVLLPNINLVKTNERSYRFEMSKTSHINVDTNMTEEIF